ncbi:MAG TPA: serine hydrolase domain-containing protein [Gemmatimonadales bacterium]|nr:serine hydrolase domain-containing protein [Gemmatimonadales bacterium]
MRRLILLLPSLLIALAVNRVSAQDARSVRAEPARFTDTERLAKLSSGFGAIDSLFRAFATREHIPGAAWGIVVDDRLAHLGVAGYRDLDSRSPVDSNSVFRIASMSKSFAAMSILSLRDRGLLALDDPAEKYVPELSGLVYPTTDSPRITIRHLLSHSTGFPEDNPWGDQQLAITDSEMSLLMQQGIPFSNAPGVAYEYSNFGFAILGRIVANVSGMPYADYVDASILRPLGMTSTTLSPASVAPGRLAQGYRWEDEQWKLEPQLPDGAFGAMGGMLTSLSDLGSYVGALLGAFPPRDGEESGPVRRSSLREMQQIWRSRPATAAATPDGELRLSSGGYGYGLGISGDCDYAHIVAHSGGLPGFGSLMRWLPEYGVGIIAFGNRTYSGWGGPVAQAFNILAETGGLQPRVPQPSSALVRQRDAVSRLVVNWTPALADSVAAMNLFFDRSADRRSAEIAELLEDVGSCEAGEGFDEVENALRGSWTLPCARGGLRVRITLSPTIPPLVQHLQVRKAPAAPVSATPRYCSE